MNIDWMWVIVFSCFVLIYSNLSWCCLKHVLRKWWSLLVLMGLSERSHIIDRLQNGSSCSIQPLRERTITWNTQEPAQCHTSPCRKQPFIFHANLLNNWTGICCWWTSLCLAKREIKTPEANTHMPPPPFLILSPTPHLPSAPHTSSDRTQLSTHLLLITFNNTIVSFHAAEHFTSNKIVEDYK